jgi:hypothetical protein
MYLPLETGLFLRSIAVPKGKKMNVMTGVSKDFVTPEVWDALICLKSHFSVTYTSLLQVQPSSRSKIKSITEKLLL